MHLIFRTSWVYATRGNNFAKTMLRLASEREELSVVADQIGAPTSAELIADVTALAIYRISTQKNTADLTGTYHLVASGETSWHGYAQYVLELAKEKGFALKVEPKNVKQIRTEDYPTPAARPKNSRLNTQSLTDAFNIVLPDWRYHVNRMIEEM
jgi:dTDP-4-dehydrorhamnose reductase